MAYTFIEQVQRTEGELRVIREHDKRTRIFLESGRSIKFQDHLIGQYPLEGIQLTQTLSSTAGISHGLAAVTALEDYLQLKPTSASLKIRNLLSEMSTLYTHLHQFYFILLPDYLNSAHYRRAKGIDKKLLIQLPQKNYHKGDLSNLSGYKIYKNTSSAQNVLNIFQQCFALIAGKFPVIMNLIPGGVSNFSFPKKLQMQLIRLLEQTKVFIEQTWPEDVKNFIKGVPQSQKILKQKPSLLSFGSLTGKKGLYSNGVYLDGKLEPLNPTKIIKSSASTTYKNAKYEHKSWILGARYETEALQTGALSRMLVTHHGGSNTQISDIVKQILNGLNLKIDQPNTLASRLLANVFESRFYIRNIFKTLFEFEADPKLNQKTKWDFSKQGVGLGLVESPAGALLHQVFIDKGAITNYRIITPGNWLFAPTDDFGKQGVILHEIEALIASGELTKVNISRVIHSYYSHIFEATL
ncbi:MAG: Ni,Fe-hydrogenase I large subunit [bacterium]|jgi:Ni,Fe-hydrogenase I large subunit